MADLLASSREASARIRVENIIHTDITVELMEILELYAELLLARAGLLDVRDKNIKDGIITKNKDGTYDESETGLEEAAAAMIYCAPRMPRDIREIGTVRAMLIERFGKEFAMRANENTDGMVPGRVTEKLRVDPPKVQLVEAYLEEIARAYGVEWPRGRKDQEEYEDLNREVNEEDDDDDDGDEDGVGGGSKEPPIPADDGSGSAPTAKAKATSQTMTPKPNKNKLDLGNLQSATPPSSLEPRGAKSPISVAPPSARTDNPSPKVRLPGGGEAKKESPAAVHRGRRDKDGKKDNDNVVGGKVPTVDDLAKRFSALKR